MVYSIDVNVYAAIPNILSHLKKFRSSESENLNSDTLTTPKWIWLIFDTSCDLQPFLQQFRNFDARLHNTHVISRAKVKAKIILNKNEENIAPSKNNENSHAICYCRKEMIIFNVIALLSKFQWLHLTFPIRLSILIINFWIFRFYEKCTTGIGLFFINFYLNRRNMINWKKPHNERH